MSTSGQPKARLGLVALIRPRAACPPKLLAVEDAFNLQNSAYGLTPIRLRTNGLLVAISLLPRWLQRRSRPARTILPPR